MFCGSFFLFLIKKRFFDLFSSENNGTKILFRTVSHLSTELGSLCVTGDPDSPPVESVFPWTSQ